ncbi:hypothetical protein CC85DRAFT_87810 [Cutaneotrichosporon oleaginosum]|uniref:Uncharacterized protein n=1 Tax=Cutaneotrichosporon oleaginosum TaxID=879819 RepID=A0A0J0XXU0_9TREE|nr:uncharacterized protein CC85DRAFT_87810 [Cutaneotrichosporon oleaginosum]KLT45881.1 hypothetical protein CC85DRAFT_87810 [Cutaneotrichosporon oleaginosum]TXT06582.1 hypothetical protein COLE_05913 [Cutaneotrichosporon oleaginosum]
MAAAGRDARRSPHPPLDAEYAAGSLGGRTVHRLLPTTPRHAKPGSAGMPAMPRQTLAVLHITKMEPHASPLTTSIDRSKVRVHILRREAALSLRAWQSILALAHKWHRPPPTPSQGCAVAVYTCSVPARYGALAAGVCFRCLVGTRSSASTIAHLPEPSQGGAGSSATSPTRSQFPEQLRHNVLSQG